MHINPEKSTANTVKGRTSWKSKSLEDKQARQLIGTREGISPFTKDPDAPLKACYAPLRLYIY